MMDAPRYGCAEIRSLLRDYADHELGPAEVARVDDHVHACKTCSDALSRAEFEVLVLRRALAPEAAAAADVPEDLGRRVLERIADEEVAAPSADFTQLVMARVSKEYQGPATRGRRFARRAVGAAVVAAVSVVAVLLALGGEERAPIARLVASSSGVEVVADGGTARRGVIGMPLEAGAVLRSAPGAQAIVELLPADPAPGLGATRIAWRGRAEIAIHVDRVDVRRGSLTIEAARPLQVGGLPGGSAALAPGRYDFGVVSQRRFDGALAREPLVGVRVEVLYGEATLAIGAERTVVASGYVARFGHWQRLEIEPGATPSRLDTARRGELTAQHTPSESDGPRWVGRVVDRRSGLGVGGARVVLTLDGGPVERTTLSDGSFAFTAAKTRIAVVDVAPPPGSTLGGIVAKPMTLPLPGEVLAPIELEAAAEVHGTVRDRTGAPLAGARVVPCVVDELFGGCDLRTALASTTDDDGAFALRGLPTELEPRQRIALLVEHAEHPPTAVAGLDPSGFAAVDVTMHEPRAVVLVGLPASRRVEILQSVPGLSASAFVAQTEVVTDAAGRATMPDAGPGRLWYFDRARGASVALERPTDGGELRPRVDARPVPVLARAGDSLARFVRLRAAPEPPTGYLTVVDRSAVVVPGTRLFLVRDGQTEFLGEFSGIEAFPFAAPDGEYAIVAVAPDGTVGWQRGEAIIGRHASIRLEPGGMVELDAPDDTAAGVRSATLLFRMIEGPLAGREFVREVRIEGRPLVDDLVPGRYVIEFDSGVGLEVDVEPQGVVVVGLPVGR